MIALVNQDINDIGIKALESYGFETVTLPPSDRLGYPLSAHPDMNLFIGLGYLFCHQSYYEKNKQLIDKLCEDAGVLPCLSDEEMNGKYPHDVLFNCLLMGDLLFCNTRSVSRKILEKAELAGVRTIHVPQGYTKCSVCPVSESAMITADKPIHDAARAHGLDSLLISPGHVSLEGYDHGFIGGASGVMGSRVFFCGDIYLHPDGGRIADLLKKHGREAVFLCSGELRDVGSILFV